MITIRQRMTGYALNALLRLTKPTHVGPMNPTFSLTQHDAAVALKHIARDRKRLARPLLVIGGFLDFGFGPRGFANRIRRYVDGDVIPMTMANCLSFNACRARVIRVVDRLLGSGAANDRTITVDAVGQSMGGLVALLAALDDPALPRRLAIGSLFTVSSPLRGAKLATLTPFNCWPMQAEMRPGSALYARLGAAKPQFPVYSYTRVGDRTVGEEFAGMHGGELWWLDNPKPERSHIGALTDGRILLDIVRRLRGDAPIATSPPAPLPTR